MMAERRGGERMRLWQREEVRREDRRW